MIEQRYVELFLHLLPLDPNDRYVICGTAVPGGPAADGRNVRAEEDYRKHAMSLPDSADILDIDDIGEQSTDVLDLLRSKIHE